MKKTLFLVMAALTVSNMAFAGMEDDKGKHEISISYGAGPASAVCDGSLGKAFSESIVTAIFGNNTGTTEEKQCFGAINIDHSYHLTSLISLGLNYSYTKTNYEGFNTRNTRTYNEFTGTTVSTEKTEKTYDKDFTYYTVMPTLKLNWFRREHITLYSRVSIGIAFRHMNLDYVDGVEGTVVKPATTISYYGDEYDETTGTYNEITETTPEERLEDQTEDLVRLKFQLSPIGVEGGWEHIRFFAELGFGQCGCLQGGLRFRF